MKDLLNLYEKTKDLNIWIDFFPLRKEFKLDERMKIGMKSCFCMKDEKTTVGSKMLKDFVSPYSSTVALRSERVGQIIGLTNQDEFCMGSTGKTSYFGITSSPWKNKEGKPMSPGGSSSGSAASVAFGFCDVALGTDTGGSVRQPAAWCGLIGLKSTYGLLSRYGVIPLASQLDHPSILAKNVKCCRTLFESLVGEDPMDPTTIPYVGSEIKHKKVGILRFDGQFDSLIDRAKLVFNEFEFEEFNLEYFKYALPIYYVMCTTTASSELARYSAVIYGKSAGMSMEEIYEGFRSDRFGEEVKRRIVVGNYLSHNEESRKILEQAEKVLNLLWLEIKKVFEKVDFILMPVASKGMTVEESLDPDPIKSYLCDFYTCFANLLGIPAISVPMGLCEEGTPVAIQLVGAPLSDGLLIDQAEVLENSVKFYEELEKLQKTL